MAERLLADLTDLDERARLSASAIQGFVKIAQKWGLTEVQAQGLLEVDAPTYGAWQADPYSTVLTQDTLTRISLAIGIFKALNTCFGRQLADQWVTRKNTGALFAGQAPIDFMIAHGQPGMWQVRRELDARCEGY